MNHWKLVTSTLVLGLAVTPLAAQTPEIQAEIEARLAQQRARVAAEEQAQRSADQKTRERYEEIEIMARLLDRGLSRSARIGSLTEPLRGAAFSPDGKVLTTEGASGSFRLWDAATGKQLAATGSHHGIAWHGMQGVYLKGQGVIYTLTVPLHFQKPVGGADKPATKPPTEWERTRKELRGEKVEAEKSREHADISIADTVLKVLADNGKNLTQLPEGENVTVAITLEHISCVKCHSGVSGSGVMGAGSGSMLRAGMPGMGYPVGTTSPFNPNQSSPPGGAVPGRGSPAYGSGASSGVGAGSISGAGSPVGGTRPTDAAFAAARADFRKNALLGDLAMKQNDYKQAADAYLSAFRQYQKLMDDSATELEVIEVAAKLARALIAQGKTQEADSIVQTILKMTNHLGSSERSSKPDMPLPGKLIITVPKKVLQTGAGMNLEEFRKGAVVEYLTFDKPAPEKPKGAAGKP